MGQGLPRSLRGSDSFDGGVYTGGIEKLASSATTSKVDPKTYKTNVVSGGTASTEIVQVGVGAEPGQRKLIVFQAEGNAADLVRLNGDGTATFRSFGIVGGTPVVITNIDLDTPGEYALLEFEGGTVWNLLYTSGATS